MEHYTLQPGDVAERPTAEAAARDALTTLRGLAEDAADRMKEILDSGELGKIISIDHTENVGNYHIAHSFNN